MKLSTLLILAFLGVILFAVFGFRGGAASTSPALTGGNIDSSKPGTSWDRSNDPNPLAHNARPPMSTPKPFDGSGTAYAAAGSNPSFLDIAISYARQHLPFLNSQRTKWELDDLRIARGYVAEVHEGRLFVNCQAWNVVQSGDWRLHAGDAFSRSPILGIMDSADELARFGTLKAVVRGTLTSSPYNPRMWSPASYLNGPLVIENCPGREGQNIKIVVAPVGWIPWQKRDVPLYTATFDLPGEQVAPGAWMWQGDGQGPLDKVQRPPR